MKRLFFFLILCLMSINIYAQRDTIYCLESKAPVVLSVPDSVVNPNCSIKLNVLVWLIREPITFADSTVFKIDGLMVDKYTVQKTLFYSATSQKMEISENLVFGGRYASLYTISFYLAIFLLTIIGLDICLMLIGVIKIDKDFYFPIITLCALLGSMPVGVIIAFISLYSICAINLILLFMAIVLGILISFLIKKTINNYIKKKEEKKERKQQRRS